MSTGGWEVELNRLMETFERESTLSLRKISRCFAAINRPFDEDFHQLLLEMSNLRLDISYNRILLERSNANEIRMPSTAGAIMPSNDHGNASSNANIPISSNGVSINVPAIVSAPAALKIEPKVDDAPIEILDSDEDSEESHSGMQTFSKGVMELVALRYAKNGGEMNDENVAEVDVKCGIKDEPELQMMDLPFDVFDPVRENEILSRENCASAPEPMENQSQTNASTSAQKQAKPSDGKRFKCNNCAFTGDERFDLNRRQSIHGGSSNECPTCNKCFRQKSALRRHLISIHSQA